MDKKDTLYARWLSGDLNAEELEELRSSGALEELEAIVKATDQAVLPAYDLEAAYQQLRGKHPTKTPKVRRLDWRYAAGIAASLLLLLVAYVLFSKKETTLLAENTQNKTFQFEDGSDVILNDGSSLSYDPATWKERRQVQLQGEAFFSVEEGNSFVVETAKGQVEVLGTKFNVRNWGDQLYVECYSGRVRVSANQQDTILNKGQSVVVQKGLMEAVQTITHEQPLWQNGISRFYEENVNAVFAELERQLDVKIETPIINQHFTGTFEHTSLEKAIRDICVPLNISYIIAPDKKSIQIQ